MVGAAEGSVHIFASRQTASMVHESLTERPLCERFCGARKAHHRHTLLRKVANEKDVYSAMELFDHRSDRHIWRDVKPDVESLAEAPETLEGPGHSCPARQDDAWRGDLCRPLALRRHATRQRGPSPSVGRYWSHSSSSHGNVRKRCEIRVRCRPPSGQCARFTGRGRCPSSAFLHRRPAPVSSHLPAIPPFSGGRDDA